MGAVIVRVRKAVDWGVECRGIGEGGFFSRPLMFGCRNYCSVTLTTPLPDVSVVQARHRAGKKGLASHEAGPFCVRCLKNGGQINDPLKYWPPQQSA